MKTLSSSARGGAFLAGLLSVVVIAALGALALDSPRPTSDGSIVYARGDDQLLPVKDDHPCAIGGSQLSSAVEAASRLTGTLHFPTHALASASNVDTIWMCTDRTIDARFASGIRFTLQPTEDDALATDWAQQIAADPAHHLGGLVGGHAAKIFDFDGNPAINEGGSVAWILEDEVPVAAEPAAGIPEATRQDLLLVVMSDTAPLETLRAVAESVRAFQ